MMTERPRKKFLLKRKIDLDTTKIVPDAGTRAIKDTIRKVGKMTALAKSMSRSPTVAQSVTSGTMKKIEATFGDTEETDRYDEHVFCEYSGPQLRINKNYLSFIEKTGNLAKDFVTLTNNGSTAIYYKWKKIEKETYFDPAVFDKEERFFCHANKNVIKPGEIKPFYFSFKSRCTGIFDEEWVIECEPPLMNPLPPIKLSGHAIQDDPNVEWRSELDMMMDARHKHRFITEILNDVFDQVRTPTPPLPDLDNPEVCKREFEEKNAKYHLYYTPVVMNLYRNLQALIYEELHLTYEDNYWDLNIEFLHDLINRGVRDNATRENFLRRYNDLLVLAKKKPIDRTSTFDYVKSKLQAMLKDFPATVNNVRREKDLMEINFVEPVELSPEELKKKQDEEAKAKAEFAKKQKKKPKNEEEERKILDEYRTQLTSQVTNLMSQQIATLQDNDASIRTMTELQNRQRPSQEYFDALAQKKNFKDLDIEEKRILIRIHLKRRVVVPVVLTEAEILAIQEAEKLKAEQKAKEEQKAAKTGKGKVKKTKEEIAEELAKQKEEEEKKKFLDSVDEKSLAEAVSVIRTCLEQLAKLVIVLVSFGEPHGMPNPDTSLKYFWEYMRNSLDQLCNFEENVKIEEFQEKMEGDFYPNNSALILENIFHQPEELGYFYDAERNLHKLEHGQIQDFANMLSTYGQVYIIEDLHNLYKDYTTMTKVKAEWTLFGPSLSTDLVLVPQAFLHCAFEPKVSERKKKNQPEEVVPKKSTIAVMGGEFSPEAILALDTILGFYDQVYVMGQVGIHFLMFKAGLKSFGTYTLNPQQQALIEKVLANAEELGKTIFVPEKLILAPKPEVKEDVPEWITSIYNTRFFWPDGYEQYLKDLAERAPPVEEQPQKKDSKKPDPKDKKQDPKKPPVEEPPVEEAGPGKGPGANLLIVGYEPSFLQQIETELYNARNILWIGSLEPFRHAGLNEANQSFALTIYNVKEERKQKPLQNAIPIEWLVSCVGEDLQEALNCFDIAVEPAAGQNRRASGEDMEGLEGQEEHKSESEAIASKSEVESMSKGGGQAERRNNMGLIADAYSSNREFALKLIGGTYLETLNLITNYEKKNEDEEEEEFSFLDEI